jgi:branched-chain amino acid transport system ATP-binding protein
LQTVSADLAQVYAHFPRLQERRRAMAGYLSGGEQQMLAIGRALMAHPRCVLLDEPSLGLAPLIVNDIFDIVRRVNRESGTTFLLVEQNARVALEVASHACVLSNGRVVLEGEAASLRENPAVQSIYLGEGAPA